MKNLIVRPSGLGDVLLMGITISSIKKKYREHLFDVVVLEDYKEIAELFHSINKVYTVPQFYYYGNPGGNLFKRHQREFGEQYNNILNWQDESIEIFRNNNDVPRVDLFVANSPYLDVKVNIRDTKLKLFSNSNKWKPELNVNNSMKCIAVCMSSVSLYRSFDESIIIDTIKKLLNEGYSVIHFGFRQLSEKIDHPAFIDHGCKLRPLELMEMLLKVNLLITVDTAAFHMATLLSVPYLAFFGEINQRLRTSHLNQINGKIFCNNDLECVRGECVRCDERPCLNDYDAEFIINEVEMLKCNSL